MKIHNFSAGPSILPQEVFQEASQGVLNFQNSGLSILEISHRSKNFVEVMEEAMSLVRELLTLSDDYEVLFVSGGASTQFLMAPMNCLPEDRTACYVDSGVWAAKAIKEAKLFGNVEVLASSKERDYTYIPKDYRVPTDAAYLHLTSNNTIFGTQCHQFPTTDVPIVCDMSSDIFSRPLDLTKFGIIYAGAQKNMGPAGTTLVIVRKDMLNRVERSIPSMLNYSTHITQRSMFNTPPVFPVYVSMLTMRWLRDRGGIPYAQARNTAKAKLLYEEIDRNPLFKGFAEIQDRSEMNATFVLQDSDLENRFLDACAEAGCSGIKGHRSVGGFRASMYNAMPPDSVEVLVQVMRDFEKNV